MALLTHGPVMYSRVLSKIYAAFTISSWGLNMERTCVHCPWSAHALNECLNRGIHS